MIMKTAKAQDRGLGIVLMRLSKNGQLEVSKSFCAPRESRLSRWDSRTLHAKHNAQILPCHSRASQNDVDHV